VRLTNDTEARFVLSGARSKGAGHTFDAEEKNVNISMRE
jgi:hypothetical protein